MKTLQDLRNGNLYLVGEINNKTYLFNGVCKFELTDNRSQHLEEVETNKTISSFIIDNLKNQYKYDFNNIIFQ